MKKIFIPLSISIAFLCSTYLTNPSTVLGQTNANLTISPPIFSNLFVAPGSSIQNSVKIYNGSTNTENITMSSDDYVVHDETGKPILQKTKSNNTYALSNFIKIADTSFTLQPNTFKIVDFTITIPATAEPGGRYAAILASIIPNSTVKNTNSIRTSLASMLVLTVSGKVKTEGNLESFSVSPSIQTNSSDVTFSQRIKNSGTIHFTPKGTIVIKDFLGNQKETIQIEQEKVFPSAIRLTQEKFKTDGLFGYYTATLKTTYSTSTTSLGKTISFFVLPIVPLLSICAGIVLLVIGILLSRKFKIVKK